MTEVDCWLPIIPESDLSDLFPNLIALPVLTSSGRVQLHVQNMPSIVPADLLIMEWRSIVGQTYEHISTDNKDESSFNDEEKSTTQDSYNA